MNWLSRMPKPALFALAALVQIGLVAVMVYDRVTILRQGTEVTLQTRPVDPRDFLRGDYVVLSYDISQVPAIELPRGSDGRTWVPVYVKLAPNADGIYALVSVHAAPVPVTGKEVLMQGKVRPCGGSMASHCTTLNVRYGIEKYFVPEGQGRDIEHARNDGKVQIVAAVTPGGRAAIKRLIVDGKSVYDEPLF